MNSRFFFFTGIAISLLAVVFVFTPAQVSGASPCGVCQTLQPDGTCFDADGSDPSCFADAAGLCFGGDCQVCIPLGGEGCMRPCENLNGVIPNCDTDCWITPGKCAYTATGTSNPPAKGKSVASSCSFTPKLSGANCSKGKCNGLGKCLPRVDGACGPAAKNYLATDTAFSGNFCSQGTSSTTPAFPDLGKKVTWSCAGTGGGALKICSASRDKPTPIDGVCGPAAKTYPSTDTAFLYDFCFPGTVSVVPAFPQPGKAVYWICNGTNGGQPTTCFARRDKLAPINGACGSAAKNYLFIEVSFSGSFCSPGTGTSSTIPAFPQPGKTVSWFCNGLNGGAPKKCSASKDNSFGCNSNFQCALNGTGTPCDPAGVYSANANDCCKSPDQWITKINNSNQCCVDSKDEKSCGPSNGAVCCDFNKTTCYQHIFGPMKNPFQMITGDCCPLGANGEDKKCGDAPNQTCCSAGEKCVNKKCVLNCCLCLYEAAPQCEAVNPILSACAKLDFFTCMKKIDGKYGQICDWDVVTRQCEPITTVCTSIKEVDTGKTNCQWDETNKKCASMFEQDCDDQLQSVSSDCDVSVKQPDPYVALASADFKKALNLKISLIKNFLTSNKCTDLNYFENKHGNQSGCPVLGVEMDACISCLSGNCNAFIGSCSTFQDKDAVKKFAESEGAYLCSDPQRRKSVLLVTGQQAAYVPTLCETPMTLIIYCDANGNYKIRTNYFNCKDLPASCGGAYETTICSNYSADEKYLNDSTYLCCSTGVDFVWKLPANFNPLLCPGDTYYPGKSEAFDADKEKVLDKLEVVLGIAESECTMQTNSFIVPDGKMQEEEINGQYHFWQNWRCVTNHY